ncbi:hypothetical protein NIES4071_49500 [Calothrix sp. NIES-4071]|nr:hypothetical protein NIES4071_49500 [Calothrix sp. NIES-4071]BAZ59257.1 hypothetical protein NIES4105_49440 [Calothrix sp. NIES-4105]
MNYTAYASVSLVKIDTLDNSTTAIIEFAKALLIDKNNLLRPDFNKLIQSFGWGKEVANNYIKLGLAFVDIDIAKLANIEPRTLFKITSSKRFAPVVQGIRNAVGHVTQQFVEHLIDKFKAPRKEKSSKPTIWRGEKDTSRTCVIPPIKEDDQYTGKTIQRAMDNEGITAQSFVREATAFWEAWQCGALILVGELPPHLQAILGDKLGTNAPINEDVEVETTSEQATAVVEVEVDDTTDAPVETVEVINEDTVAPQIEIAINEDSSETENIIEPASAEQIATLIRSCQTWSDITAITESIDKSTRIQSWTMLDKSEQQRILDIKFRDNLQYETPKEVGNLAYKL